MSVIVLCAGGHARVVIEALLSRGIRPAAVIDRDAARVGEAIGGVPIRGSDDDVMKTAVDTVELANGLGNRASRTNSGLSGRRALFGRFAAMGYKFPVIAHAAAVIASDVQLGDGAQVMAGAVIQPAARIGQNVLVNTRAVVEHDCVVGDHAHVAPGAVLCGGCRSARASISAPAPWCWSASKWAPGPWLPQARWLQGMSRLVDSPATSRIGLS